MFSGNQDDILLILIGITTVIENLKVFLEHHKQTRPFETVVSVQDLDAVRSDIPRSFIKCYL